MSYFQNNEKFISQSKKKHGDIYDYSLVNYISYNQPVEIICPNHGVFSQKPTDHKDKGRGCQKCGLEKANFNKKDNSHFIKVGNEVHNFKYDYSLVEYINKSSKVRIICSIHGEFLQIPNSHLRGKGCHTCKESKGEKLIASLLDSKGVKYNREYRFNDCRNKYPLPFDFFIESMNQCIEFDGRQHYQVLEYLGEGKFITQVLNDSIKNKYCTDNGIKLLRIRYDDNIESKISELINE